jgi:hypothetical protein
MFTCLTGKSAGLTPLNSTGVKAAFVIAIMEDCFIAHHATGFDEPVEFVECRVT